MDPFEHMSHNGFLVTHCSKRAKCQKCEESVEYGQVTVIDRPKWKYYHMRCFTLNRRYPVSVKTVLHTDNPVSEVVEWLTQHNSQFIPSIPSSKPLQFTIPYNPRLLLSAFQFLDSLSILRVSSVCRVWYKVTLEPELWQVLSARDYTNPGLITSKTAYFALERRICYHCKSSDGDEMCPIMLKPLCKKCRLSDDFELVTKKEMQKMMKCTGNWINRRKIPLISAFSRTLATYKWIFRREIKAVRRALKRRLVSFLRFKRVKTEFLSQIENIDLRVAYKNEVCRVAAEYIRRADDSNKEYSCTVKRLEELVSMENYEK